MVNLILYIPAFGNIVFKDYHITGEGFIDSVMSKGCFDNFKFSSSKDVLHYYKKYGIVQS